MSIVLSRHLGNIIFALQIHRAPWRLRVTPQHSFKPFLIPFASSSALEAVILTFSLRPNTSPIPHLNLASSDDIFSCNHIGYNEYHWGMLLAASPLHLSCRQNLTAKGESIPDQHGFDFVLGLNTSTYTVRLLIQTWSLSSYWVVLMRRLFTGQQGGITIQWICVLQSALIDGLAPMWGCSEL